MPSKGAVRVPGRVNLIGEHIDYLGLPVLPMAIEPHISIDCTKRGDNRIRAASEGFGEREFGWTREIEPYAPGDWGNYIKAGAQAVGNRWGIGAGLDAVVSSSIPPAAGLSSSSALVIGVTLALLRIRGIRPDFTELMEVLPEGEMYVGTRGGAMDHAICLAGRRGFALRIGFNPVTIQPAAIPEDWAFFVAHSLRRAEKSGAVREEYNLRRTLAQAGDPAALRHANSEARRVEDAIRAMRLGDREEFGEILNASHRSLRDDLRVSCEPADLLASECLKAGALGARIMGAGFGGYVVALCEQGKVEEVMNRLERDHFAGLPGREQFPGYLMRVEAADGALAGLPGALH